MQKETEGCAHTRPEDNAGCPFDCKTWLKPFPWNSTNARFENGGIVEFMDLLENLPDVNKIFQTLDLVYDQRLFKLYENATRAEQDWTDKLVNTLVQVKSLPTLTSQKELQVFKELVSEKLKQYVDTMELKCMPNVLIITPKETDESLKVKVIYNNANKRKQLLTFDDFALIHKSMPGLKSLNIDSLNMLVSGDEQVIVNNNDLESIRISLASRINSPVALFIFLLQSYHWNVTTFKLEMEDGKIKQDELIDDGNALDRAFGEITFQLEYLETLEINNFYHSINIAAFLRNLGSTSCKLKHVTLLGQPDSRHAFFYMVKDHANTLESLTVSTFKYESISDLSNIKSLRKFSYKWDSLDEHLDILKVLISLPNLEYLELGHTRIQGDWVSQVVNADIYPNLTTLSLSNVNIKETAFEDLNQQLPNLKNIYLSHCRIGTNRQETDSTIKFGTYILDTLVLDNCKLFYSRKEARPKGRMIARYMLSMEYHEPYAATMKYDSAGDESQSKLYIDEGYFVYDVSGNLPEISNANVLRIKANMIRSFSISKNAPEYVAFCPEKEITDLKGNSSVIQPDNQVESFMEACEVVEIIDDSDNEVVVMEETHISSKTHVVEETPSVNKEQALELEKSVDAMEDITEKEISQEDLIMEEMMKDDALLEAMESIKGDVYVISQSEDEEDKTEQIIPDSNKEENQEEEIQEKEIQEKEIQEKEIREEEIQEELAENFAEDKDIPNSNDQKEESPQKNLEHEIFSVDDDESEPETKNDVDDQSSAAEGTLDQQAKEAPDEEEEQFVFVEKTQVNNDEDDEYSENSVFIDIEKDKTSSSDGEYATDLNVSPLVSSESESEEEVVAAVRISPRKKPMNTINRSLRKRARLDRSSDEEEDIEVASTEANLEEEIDVEALEDGEADMEANEDEETDMEADGESDGEEEDDTVRYPKEEMKHRELVAEFLENCQDFKAVVRVPFRKRAKITHR